MSIKNAMSKKITQKTKFMGEPIEIVKLTVAQVKLIQEKVKGINEGSGDEQGLDTLKAVIRIGVVEAEDLTDEDFDSCPLDDLSKLSAEIMKFSGLGQEQKGNDR
jgi:hypothetical protein